MHVIGSARCNNDAQCKSIGIGSRPCGGPDYYVAWSTTTGSTRVLFGLTSRYREQQRVLSEKTAMASTCDIQRDPGAFCSDAAGADTGRCVIRPRGGLGSDLR